MKLFINILLLHFFLIGNLANALEAGKWLFVNEDEYCYIGSLPIDTDLPKNKQRGDTWQNVKI